MNAGLRAGYKLTDLGVIPEDWEVKRICDIASVGSGGTPRREVPAYWGGSIPWVTTSQVDFGAISEAGQYITDEGLQNSPAKLLPPGTLLMALYGQGKTRGKVGVLAMQAATNQACASISLYQGVSREFVLHFLTSRYEQIRKSSNSGSQENLNGNIVKGLLIASPSPTEQRAIAAALSDVDALLAGLDRLIAKKRDLKQAAMQQLLTGQTRLPGFQGEWEVKRLGEHVSFLKNGVHSRAELTNNGPVKNLHYGDIHASGAVTLAPSLMPSLSNDDAHTLNRLTNGDLVFVDASEDLDGVGKSVEIVGATGVQFVAGLHTIAARFDHAVLAHGFKAYLQFCPPFRMHLKRLAAGTKVYATNRRHISSAELPLPNVQEQTAIASALSDMDAELSALEARRNKTRALKQAMMQELLTGKTRLV